MPLQQFPLRINLALQKQWSHKCMPTQSPQLF